jgi:Raf kinase inhibitor-like YbhB/YbcL family protein
MEDRMAVETDVTFALDSPRFPAGGSIPRQYTLDGDNISPLLRWNDPPKLTRSFALFMEDISAPDRLWRHWAVYDIPHEHRHVPDGGSSKLATEALPHGFNDFGHARYDGPDPRPGEPAHTYRFRLLALDVWTLDLPAGPAAGRVLEEARAHTIAEAELSGTYQRQPT